jgi:hypothetical protein
MTDMEFREQQVRIARDRFLECEVTDPLAIRLLHAIVEELESDLRSGRRTRRPPKAPAARLRTAPHAAHNAFSLYTAARVLRKIEYSEVCAQMYRRFRCGPPKQTFATISPTGIVPIWVPSAA